MLSAKELKEKYYELVALHRKERLELSEKQGKAEREAWDEFKKKTGEENATGKPRYKF